MTVEVVPQAEPAALRIDFSRCPAQSHSFRKLVPGNRVCNAWGRGTGKSWFARTFLYLNVAKYEHEVRTVVGKKVRGVRQILLMPTISQFEKTNREPMERELAPDGDWGFLRARIDHTRWIVRFPGGSYIQVVSAQVIQQSRGIRCDVVVADEADDIEWTEFVAICGPWFSEPESLNVRLITGTPRRGRHGLLYRAYSIWPRGQGDETALDKHYGFHASYKDAPSLVSAEVVAEAKRSWNPNTFAREWECDFDSGEGLVYPFFDLGFHVRPPPGLHLFREFIVGFDYGFSDPAAFVVIGIAGKGKDTICHVLREYYVTGKSDTELAEIASTIEAAFPGARWYSDHHPSTVRAFHQLARVDVALADKTYKVEDGVAFVADAMFVRSEDVLSEDGGMVEYRHAQFYVDPSCVNLIREMGLYRRKRDPRNTERVLDDIDTSDNDHAADAVRYAMVSRFAGPDRRLVLG